MYNKTGDTMKTKKYKDEYGKEPIKKDKTKKEKQDHGWIITVTIVSFIISFLMALISELVIPNAVISVSIFLVLVFIFIGIIFDAIGLAAQTADSKIFHSMATKKVKGAKKAIELIKNKDKVSSLLNDVIGDICGVVSGSCGLAISITIANMTNTSKVLVTIIVTSIISSLTIGGKAFGKTIAINNANEIIFEFSKILNIFSKNK